MHPCATKKRQCAEIYQQIFNPRRARRQCCTKNLLRAGGANSWVQAAFQTTSSDVPISRNLGETTVRTEPGSPSPLRPPQRGHDRTLVRPHKCSQRQVYWLRQKRLTSSNSRRSVAHPFECFIFRCTTRNAAARFAKGRMKQITNEIWNLQLFCQ